MKIKYLGHSTIEVSLEGCNIIIDPFISPNPKANHINVSDLKPDYIFLTHGHEDHVADAELLSKNNNAPIVSNFEVNNWFTAKGCENGVGMNIGGTFKTEFFSLKMVEAKHSSSMPDGSYGGNPAGFILQTEKSNIYIAGDTALFSDMKLIGEECDLDLAILPIGDLFTMGIRDASKSAEMINCSKVLGVHYDTFPVIEIDHKQAIETFKEENQTLLLLPLGDTIEL
ncbi:metal-dependent hydrolase [Sediminitomix flava]|uniref:UPF0173 metal-dependent hydrolase BC781_102283 n=1 Tax=Sediminitomix flava TaxID=379075 RepID=A0A315ZD18_SEDFL|nr:metal-dependent hydrolase [Sediminitomix flava]PWJ42738.1 L-ascorbate metabolism protein UlaG (beta-lactamase superfamily) [Sediminitomix flava]